MVNFGKALKSNNLKKQINPIDFYDSLDRKSATGPLRPVQHEVLKEWFESKREQRDLIIKLHTGEGKTLIGLLMLLSRIYELNCRCLYVCPNKHLAKQAALDAEKFGIPHCLLDQERDLPLDFLDGNKILITHVQKVFNGKTIFGVNQQSIEIDNLILDDSHACIDSIKSACSMRIKRTEALYTQLLDLFHSDLQEQGEGDLMDIKLNISDSIMQIPYWAWIDKKSDVLALIANSVNDISSIAFTLPLLKNHLEHCSAFINTNGIEIIPDHIPIESFAFFHKAKQRILMSATTQDDSFFVKGLGFEQNAISFPLINRKSNWSGEKMIVIPSLVDESLDRDLMRTAFAKPNNKRSVGYISLIPSFWLGETYKQLGSIVVDGENIEDAIKKLKDKEYSQTIVFVNRYDGIDLPDEMCRVLMIDSIPYFNSLGDRYEMICREDSKNMNIKIAQKIEQGLGRSVRGEKDYSIILLVGADLVRFVKSKKTANLFSLQTQKQIEIGITVADLAKSEIDSTENSIKIINTLINQCLQRDPDWKAFYQENMNSLKDEHHTESALMDILIKEYNAEKAFYKHDYPTAYDIIQGIVREIDDDVDKSWYLQLLAKYKYFISPVESENIQKKAFLINTNLLKPKSGITYKKIGQIDATRIANIKKYLSQFDNYSELKLCVDNLLTKLSFGSNSDDFEKELMNLGLFLGFEAQRPDKQIRKGPDVLWGNGNSRDFFMFECKNQVALTRMKITKDEAGQMSNHCGWFEEEYGKNVSVERFLIIPTNILAYDANMTHEVGIINKIMLEKLKKSICGFVKELMPYDISQLTNELIQSFLVGHNLTTKLLQNNYHVKIRKD